MHESELKRLLGFLLGDEPGSDDDDQIFDAGTLRERLIETRRQLREMRILYRNVVEQLPAFLYIDSPEADGETYYASPKIEEILGITPQQYVDDADSWWDMIHPDDRQRALDDYESYAKYGYPDRGDFRYIKPDGSVVWVHDRSSKIYDDDGNLMLVQGVMFDITQQKEAELAIQHMAFHDTLTGLPNRRMFEQHLDLALARAKRDDLSVGVLFCDLDQFKLVNDSLGHAVGDELLRQVAVRLQDATRDTDLIARQGGDEFLVLVGDIERGEHGSDVSTRVAQGVADRIAEAFRRPFTVGGIEMISTPSIGISLFPDDARDAQELMRNADAAMYVHKRSGGGHSAVHAAGSDAMEQLSSLNRLRRAVEEEDWELHYQPIVDLSSGDVLAVEALLRWRDPAGGITRPGEFIPLAEESGLIQSIGDWVLGEACRQMRAWRDEGIELDVSVNVSPLQLGRSAIVDEIGAHLDDHDLPHDALIVELTESSAMADPEQVQKLLWELRGRGVRIAIDDFGTGASSLARLRHLPVEILKIDRAFVADTVHDPNAASMVGAIVELARTLGMVPLAEAVETREQRAIVQRLGCTLAQGYLFHRPVPAEDLAADLREGRLHLLPRETKRIAQR
jgi:diguanylate cyclase (GGDEF)-like protein/PAS domain S-box-containing protein